MVLARFLRETIMNIKVLHKHLHQLTPNPKEKIKYKDENFNSKKIHEYPRKHYGGLRNHQLDQVN